MRDDGDDDDDSGDDDDDDDGNQRRLEGAVREWKTMHESGALA